jgi:hypothetical protein
MLSTEDREILDKLWSSMWPATELKRLAVLDYVNALLFIKQLDDGEIRKEKNSGISLNNADQPFFSKDQQNLRWNSFQQLNDEELYELFTTSNGVLEFINNITESGSLKRFDKKENKLLAPPRGLLAKTISLINQLNVRDDIERGEMINYLLQKSETSEKPLQLELNQAETIPEQTEAPRRIKISQPLSKTLLFVFLAFIAIAVGYLLWEKYSGPKSNLGNAGFKKESRVNDTSEIVASEDQTVHPDAVLKQPTTITANKNSSTKDTISDLQNTNKTPVVSSEPEKKATKAVAVEPKPSTTAVADESRSNTPPTEIKGRYKIAGKAYFHDEPDETTRRDAFVIHWNNSYATLEALDETTNFIYVEFRNHKKQVSKGWLRKKDLIPLD